MVSTGCCHSEVDGVEAHVDRDVLTERRPHCGYPAPTSPIHLAELTPINHGGISSGSRQVQPPRYARSVE